MSEPTKIYLYMQVYDREICTPDFFTTYEAAYAEMVNDFCEAIGEDAVDELTENYGFRKENTKQDIQTDDCQISSTFAWANDCGINHENWDAKITELPFPIAFSDKTN